MPIERDFILKIRYCKRKRREKKKSTQIGQTKRKDKKNTK